jgi:hypothetical protein
MYTIYLRAPDQSITEKTRTACRTVALSAFKVLVQHTQFDGTMMRAILNYQDIAIAHHRFSVPPGNDDFWRGRVDQLALEVPSSLKGEPAGGRSITLFLDAKSLARAEALGGGNAADGLRKALHRPHSADELVHFNSLSM